MSRVDALSPCFLNSTVEGTIYDVKRVPIDGRTAAVDVGDVDLASNTPVPQGIHSEAKPLTIARNTSCSQSAAFKSQVCIAPNDVSADLSLVTKTHFQNLQHLLLPLQRDHIPLATHVLETTLRNTMELVPPDAILRQGPG